MGKINISIWSDLQTFLLKAHPVGSYYWSNDPTNPHILFGGDWTQIKGRFVWAKEDSQLINSLGGERTVTLTEAQLPKVDVGTMYTDRPLSLNVGTAPGYSLMNNSHPSTLYGGDGELRVRFGGGQSHENMPPYISAYCWRRTL